MNGLLAHGILLVTMLALWTAPAHALDAASTAADGRIDRVVESVDRKDPSLLLTHLTRRFGSRLTGSEDGRRAAAWTLQYMRELGLSRVHAESWPLGEGWKRGQARAWLPGPPTRELEVTAYGWTGSTPGPVTGSVVLLDGNRPIDEVDASDWADKVVLVSPLASDGIRGVAEGPALVALAEKAHALAFIDGVNRPGAARHTGPLGFPAVSSRLPVLDMSDAQREELADLVRAGTRPQLRIDVDNEFIDGPIAEANVVGDIVGATHPEEIVLLAAHLDAWDLATGATDDGVGVATVLGAVAAIRDSGVRPARTIRVVLFTGEEQGLLGSQAYVERHASELPDIVCVVALDWGTGRIVQFPLAGHPELSPVFERVARLRKEFAGITVAPGFLTFTDAFAFTLAGVPAIAPLQVSPDYDAVAHSAGDSMDRVDLDGLRFNTRVMAATAMVLADADVRPGRKLTPDEVRRSLAILEGALRLLHLSVPEGRQ